MTNNSFMNRKEKLYSKANLLPYGKRLPVRSKTPLFAQILLRIPTWVVASTETSLARALQVYPHSYHKKKNVRGLKEPEKSIQK